MVNGKRCDVVDAFVVGGVEGESDSGGECGPTGVVVIGKQAHTAVPEAPKNFNRASLSFSASTVT